MPNLPHQNRLIRYHILISGKVQGVGYRISILQVAKQFNLNGWVQNLPDNRVEAIFEGNSLDIEQILSRFRQSNSIAVVQDIAVKEETPEGKHSFEIRY